MFVLILIISAVTAVGAQKPTCLITAPNIVHLGTEETVSVQLHGATKPANIALSFRHQTADMYVSDIKHITLNEANGYQAVVKLKVDIVLFEQALKKKKSHNKYIQLVADSMDVFKTKRMAQIILSTKKGYIFIQTDKPIYNPGETVNFRVFTLDNYMLPTEEVINIKIFNSRGLVTYSHNLQSEQILQKSIIIPDVEPAGHWKILASFLQFPMSSSTVEFEVREYVLPSFEVKIEASEPYHTLKAESFQFNVSARYTYGKGVNGIAYIRFAIIDEQGNRTYLSGIEKQTPIQDGIASIAVLTEDLQNAAENQSFAHIEGSYLYIGVTVLEKASGDLEEAESSSVRIVTSPYIIDTSKTKDFFTPEGMFSVLTTTTYPDGSRVPLLKMRASVTFDDTKETLSVEGIGNPQGDAVLTFKVPKQARSMAIKVFAKGDEGEVILSDAKMTATAVQATGDGYYLSVEVQHRVLQLDQEMTVTLRDITPAGTSRPSHIYYMILSKGKVLQLRRVPRTELTIVSLPYSVDLVPSFRLLAYYFTDHRGNTKIVADSVWVDVKDVCKGQIEIAPLKVHKPAELIEVEVHTEQASKVALAAVDSAVYILNKQNKLTPQRMFDYMNSYDLACSVGGGKDHQTVLHDAGLTFICSCDMLAMSRTEHTCNNGKKRQRRGLNHFQKFSAMVNRYKNKERKCCNDGAKLNRMGLSCDERHKKTTHMQDSCRDAFYKCCMAATEMRKKIRTDKRKMSLARSDASEEEDAIDEASIHLRSYFPQSWMWVVLNSNLSGNIRHAAIAPDSITTWEVQAVGISKTTGFCIAEPKPLKVFQDFFVSVKLPYSVKRNEQLEVKAVVYNYREDSLKVTVEMDKVEGLCSAGGDRARQEVTVPGNSAVAVYFTVVPLIIGNIPIDVVAYTSTSARDRIRKDLRVMGEGELISLHKEYNINAKVDNTLEVDIPAPPDAIPDMQPATYMSVRGGVMGESVDNCLNLEGVDRLIALPTGCAEQTMVKMSPAIHSMRYLDASDQWFSLKAERRSEAQEMIQSGYNRILTFKKEDGSYGAFLATPSSVWLTAFIAKELTESRDIIPVDDLYIQQSISYLVSKQKSSGAFDDPNPLYDRGMKGGVGKLEGDVPLTAFILVAMKHALEAHDVGESTELRMAMEKARSYLAQELDSLEKPFPVAITAYALSLTGPNSADARRAQRKLRGMAKCDQGKGTCHWDARENPAGQPLPQADSLTVETTAYGLLQAVSEGDKRYAKRIAKWLTEQRKYGGGFRSTQDTVVALQALAKFSIQNNDVEDLDLKVKMCLQSGRIEEVKLTKRNAFTQSAIEVKQGGKVSVSVKGSGEGTLSIVHIYRSLKKPESYCDHFHINISVEGELKYKNVDYGPEFDDYYNYEAEEDGSVGDEPLSRVEWFDLRSRRKRHVPQGEPKETSLVYTVCLGMISGNSTGMVIVDISLLSGLNPIIKDLEDNAKDTEKYIDHYDIGPNKVYLYFHKISESVECIQFRAEQIVPMGLVQPAAAVIYDYYNPEKKCGLFYGAPQKSTMISKLCDGDVCSCAEGGCPKLKVTYSKDMERSTRSNFACFSPIVNYVYMIKILNSTDDGIFKYYSTLVTNVLQTGKDATIQMDATREMIQRKACDGLDMKIDGEYLIMGQEDTILDTSDSSKKYILKNKMWIEEIPEKRKCKATRNRVACQLLQDFIQQHELNQCHI